MRTKSLGRYVQVKMTQDIVADATAEAVAATAALITQARAEAVDAGEDPDRAEKLVGAVPLRNIDDEVPTLEWCDRIAKKHGKDSKGKVGKMKGLKEEILDRVKKDPDNKGKKRKQPPQAGGRPD